MFLLDGAAQREVSTIYPKHMLASAAAGGMAADHLEAALGSVDGLALSNLSNNDLIWGIGLGLGLLGSPPHSSVLSPLTSTE